MTTTESPYRAGLPPIPWRMRFLPIERGYPVPWFVAEVDGHYDFRAADARKLRLAIEQRLCWVCGKPLGAYLAFCIGPMCCVNRTISEPPSHRECAEYSILGCPFLTQQEHKRRDTNLPEGYTLPAGEMIMRQPGVSVLWVCKRYQPFQVDNGILFKIGDPTEVRWYREGRPATRAECLESIDSGYPILLKATEADGPKAVGLLEAARDRALRLLPDE